MMAIQNKVSYSKTFLRKSLLKTDEKVTENKIPSPELGGHENEFRHQPDTDSDTDRIQTSDSDMESNMNRINSSDSDTNSDANSETFLDDVNILIASYWDTDSDKILDSDSGSDTGSDTSSDTGSYIESDIDADTESDSN